MAVLNLMNSKTLLFIGLLFITTIVQAQRKTATVSGKVVTENEVALPGVSVSIIGQDKTYITNDSGYFSIRLIADRGFRLQFSHTGFRKEERDVYLSAGENEYVVIRLVNAGQMMQEVEVSGRQAPLEGTGLRLNPKTIRQLPAPVGGVEALIKVLVMSNNELTSQYSVRGGSYDENLVYVNDFEVFRPYLIRNGQQEGLSFINPDLVRNIQFYNGGFQARYGDKMSSVLDVDYIKPKLIQPNGVPKYISGSAYIGFLEQGLHLEGINKNEKLTWLLGLRNRYNRNLLKRQQTTGNYVPSSNDAQLLVTYKPTDKWTAEFFGNASLSKFTMVPVNSVYRVSEASPLETKILELQVYEYLGRETDAYQTNFGGVSLTHNFSNKNRLKFLASRFQNIESENIDIQGKYLFGEVDDEEPGSFENPLAAGIFHNYSRNRLNITNYNYSVKWMYNAGRHALQAGAGLDKTFIKDKLHEWEMWDSAGYSIPYDINNITLKKFASGTADFAVNKLTAYIQDNMLLADSTITISAGIRLNHNSLNDELLVSPRVGLNWRPKNNDQLLWRFAAGAYHQPPFYREMRRYDGTINMTLQAQKSWQASAGMDYNFLNNKRRMRLSTEAYYKRMTDVVPYDIDNVRLRYFGENNAKAYAAGIEMRLFGELVKDAESWVSVGIMQTMEDIVRDTFWVAGSRWEEKGWVRRPTDRRINFGMYFQDYLTTNENIRVYVNLLFGSNLPYNLPGNARFRGDLTIPPYIRADIGFSALLLDSDRTRRRSHNPFMGFNNIWASLEVFNLIDRDNTISYLLIKDFSNTVYNIPQRLTPRLINFKIIGRW